MYQLMLIKNNMLNPNEKFVIERVKRPTMWRIAKDIGITQPALWKWFNGRTSPRLVNLQILAKHMNCTVDEALDAIKRTQAVYKHTKKLPYGLMIEKDMMVEEYKALAQSEK